MVGAESISSLTLLTSWSNVIKLFIGRFYVSGHELAKDIIEIPPDLFDNLVRNLSPLALQNIHEFLER